MRRPSPSRSAQGQIEYAVALVLTTMVVLVILLTMGNNIRNLFSNIACDHSWSTSCIASITQPSPAPTASPAGKLCPTLNAPTLAPERSSTPVYTFTPSDFNSHQQVLQGSIVRFLIPCPQSQASYRFLVGTALTPILSSDNYAVFVTSSPGTSQIGGPTDHSSKSSPWSIDITVVAP